MARIEMISEGRCAGCGEACETRLITLALPRSASGIAVFRNVPAEVCPRCGEQRFSMETAHRLLVAARNDRPPDAIASIPVYDLGLQSTLPVGE